MSISPTIWLVVLTTVLVCQVIAADEGSPSGTPSLEHDDAKFEQGKVDSGMMSRVRTRAMHCRASLTNTITPSVIYGMHGDYEMGDYDAYDYPDYEEYALEYGLAEYARFREALANCTRLLNNLLSAPKDPACEVAAIDSQPPNPSGMDGLAKMIMTLNSFSELDCFLKFRIARKADPQILSAFYDGGQCTLQYEKQNMAVTDPEFTGVPTGYKYFEWSCDPVKPE